MPGSPPLCRQRPPRTRRSNPPPPSVRIAIWRSRAGPQWADSGAGNPHSLRRGFKLTIIASVRVGRWRHSSGEPDRHARWRRRLGHAPSSRSL